MIDITRIRRSRLKNAEIGFKSIIRQAVEQLSKLENAHRLEISLVAEGAIPFYNDPEQLQVIFTNLISNAIKYQHPHERNPKLTISVETDQQKSLITFRDNGIGIPDSEIGKVFDMFYRVPGTRAEGSGLGLYIVKEVIRKLKGRIYTDAAVKEGCAFVIELPNKIDPDYVRKISRLLNK